MHPTARTTVTSHARHALAALLCAAFLATAAAQSGEPEPYVVKGRVTDSRGAPMAGVEVYADNTAFYDMNVFGVSDADGYYRIELGGVTPSSWRVGAMVERKYNGMRLRLSLHPSDASVFAGATGAVRDLTWLMSGETPEGFGYGATVYVYERSCCEVYVEDMGLVELTLEPTAPLLDGSTGETLVVRLDHYDLQDVPLTSYRASARYLPEDGPPVAMLVRARDVGDYLPAAEVDFRDSWGSPLLELEIRLP